MDPDVAPIQVDAWHNRAFIAWSNQACSVQRLPWPQVIDVTSKGDVKWQMLSPFFAHGDIAIPGAEPGCTAKSVEGIWQGLKVFPDGKGIDARKFSNGTMQNLKQSPRGEKDSESARSAKKLVVYFLVLWCPHLYALPWCSAGMLVTSVCRLRLPCFLE